MPNITKSAVRAFILSEYRKKHEPLRNARKEALRSAIESSHLRRGLINLVMRLKHYMQSQSRMMKTLKR